MKYFLIICRVLLGIVFIFSGFVKGVDPVGSYIKFSEYLEAFHLTWLEPVSLVLSNIQNIFELVIGISLIIGLRMRLTSWATLIFMSFYLVLTLYIAIASPVQDCGCFGDALVISNWATFYKNIVLMALAIIVFLNRNKFQPFSGPAIEWGLVAFFTVVSVSLSVYCYNHLPIVDFRPYSVGTHIPTKMTIPAGAPIDQYESIITYEKNGVTKDFSLENLPDSTWTWKSSRSKLIKKGYVPPIHDFSISTTNGDIITSAVLSDTSYSFIFILQDATRVKPEIWKRMKEYQQFASQNSKKFYILTSSPQSILDEVKHKTQLSFDFYFTDGTTLKTIIRSNPGLMLLKDGVVLGLWHYHDFPAPEYFKGNILSKVLTAYNKSIESKRVLILLLGFVVIVVALFGFRNKI